MFVFCMVFVQFLCGYLAVLEWKMDEGKVYRKLGFSGGGGDGHKKRLAMWIGQPRHYGTCIMKSRLV